VEHKGNFLPYVACRMYNAPSKKFSTKYNPSNTESELLCDWRFTANQFVLATSPLRPTTRVFFLQLNPCGHKSRRMRWAAHVAQMGAKRNAYRILMGKPEGKRPPSHCFCSPGRGIGHTTEITPPPCWKQLKYTFA
jgi:hypothetical protein